VNGGASRNETPNHRPAECTSAARDDCFATG